MEQLEEKNTCEALTIGRRGLRQYPIEADAKVKTTDYNNFTPECTNMPFLLH